jgi:hypothetical protein
LICLIISQVQCEWLDLDSGSGIFDQEYWNTWMVAWSPIRSSCIVINVITVLFNTNLVHRFSYIERLQTQRCFLKKDIVPSSWFLSIYFQTGQGAVAGVPDQCHLILWLRKTGTSLLPTNVGASYRCIPCFVWSKVVNIIEYNELFPVSEFFPSIPSKHLINYDNADTLCKVEADASFQEPSSDLIYVLMTSVGGSHPKIWKITKGRNFTYHWTNAKTCGSERILKYQEVEYFLVEDVVMEWEKDNPQSKKWSSICQYQCFVM